MAAFLGFRDIHVFGMDGCTRDTASHAGEHPNAPNKTLPCEYDGTTYMTTPSMLETARQTWHELDQLPTCKVQFYGEGLVQAMAKNYVRKDSPFTGIVAVNRPEVISDSYRKLNEQLHKDNLYYGVGGAKHADAILKLSEALKTTAVLDYGCGKGMLAKALPFPIWEYDPAVPGKTESPRPADIVVCTDVLEHIEPELLLGVISDLKRVTRKVGYFVIHTGPSSKVLADGRNAHLLQRDRKWWKAKLTAHFKVARIIETAPLLHVIVGPKEAK
jgi:2-polyprenyl-3-methyl-5-hydroxy-6-metoxy-1,4-benzoquinol methylase